MNELLIETYIEAQEAPVDKEQVDQYNEALVNLGLEHLAIKNDESPIAPMSLLEYNVYKTLCPNKTEINKYTHPIPLRVLEAYAKCKNYLEKQARKDGNELKVEIWDDEEPDPLMIARFGWRNNNSFLIGRWGKELQDFPTLLKRAKELALSETLSKINEAKSIIDMYEKDKDAFAMAVINEKLSSIYFR